MNNVPSPQQQTRAVWTGIISDFAIAAGKGAVGYFSGSRALMADALHSAANGLALLAARGPSDTYLSRRFRKDNDHNSDAERMGAILVPLLLVMGGLWMSFAAIRDVFSRTPEVPKDSALLVVLISLMVKEAVFQYHARNQAESSRASFQVHSRNHRTGIYASMGVIIGIGLSMAAPYIGWNALLYSDWLMAFLISLVVVYKGLKRMLEALEERDADLPPSLEHSADYYDTIQRVYGVITIEELKVHPRGHAQVQLDVRVTVNPKITVWEAHEIAERIRKLLQHRFVQIIEAQIITVPYETGYPYKSNYDLIDNDLPTLPQ
ncbi:cation diffusion facilitator family transporter [Paenibacillus lemnae]|uniref:Cation diffusion facilitator family transporter n=1 Tax=Paenibacillus lemnae TaxID=1330551 RepID=A0A848M806_PAELE|nr:cation diffusion facilitator family transporter [Paenibacillus lemnae]